ncbi:hypothetical protein EW145_g1999 [Phellinidium pouzarii]|uniref:Uncharacterized protein n=1 Tax=Phellinidium pouzarii TaxID=167371 RepID=A0A4S4LI09_9AGAM|nr:hypothetical protein EW145_g1999 [Phellinidium pouzarii]
MSVNSYRPKCDFQVAFLWFLNAFHIALILSALYRLVVTEFNKHPSILVMTWDASVCNFQDPSIFSILRQQLVLFTFFLLVGLEVISFIIRIYYSYRIWIASKKTYLLAAVAILLAITSFSSGIAGAIKTLSSASILNFPESSWLLYLITASGLISDSWITVSLCYLFWNNGTNFKQ